MITINTYRVSYFDKNEKEVHVDFPTKTDAAEFELLQQDIRFKPLVDSIKKHKPELRSRMIRACYGWADGNVWQYADDPQHYAVQGTPDRNGNYRSYQVYLLDGEGNDTCTCPDKQSGATHTCKHMLAARLQRAYGHQVDQKDPAKFVRVDAKS